ncbi:MAG TPA: acetolactate synthase large subunit [Steroidobacter sp.]|uniref:acetolactate synthase large subunit n=1 Tax=Steroidobacter sp. TaxID=1978227 RepID=UPI002ED7BDDC
MNGAEALIRTLHSCGVDVCFANPGTSEMQLVAAIDRQEGMRAILGLFEGVVTGAADGYGRMADKPAVTLLHLGSGMGNGLANLHNARRAASPIINIVGEHATYHLHFDAPLTSDIAGIAAPVSDWVRTSRSSRDLARAGAEAFSAAQTYPGKVATVIAPADHAWCEGAAAVAPAPPVPAPRSPKAAVDAAVAALRSGKGAKCLFLGGRALREDTLWLAGRIAAASGARLVCETFPARHQRGAGRVPVEKLPYFGEQARAFLEGLETIVFCGAEPPVSFFAYPGKPSWLSPDKCNMVRLASAREDARAALEEVASALDAPAQPANVQQAQRVPCEEGKLNPAKVAAVLCELMPENAIVSDEAATATLALFPMTAGARPHDWLTLTGGAIGQGLPLAVGAAVACPDRKVIALQADGSGMYTNQALWTMAREQLDVVTIIFNNGSYAILNIELQRVGVGAPGPKALSMLDLTRPAIHWTHLAQGMGVPAVRAATTAEFRQALTEALNIKGPRLIEAML